jgi:hypothetical protein
LRASRLGQDYHREAKHCGGSNNQTLHFTLLGSEKKPRPRPGPEFE